MTLSATRDPREALEGWIASTGYTYREVGELFGVTKDAPRQWTCGAVRVPTRVQARLRAEGWLPRRKRGPAPPPQDHQPRCPPGSPCRSCRTRRLYAAGEIAPRWRTWPSEHDARLTALAGSLSLPDLATQLSQEFGIPRTQAAVRTRATRLGLSLRYAAVSTTQIAYYCARSAVTVQHWAARGWLRGYQPSGPHSPYVFSEADITHFFELHYAWLDWSQMPRSRWRNLAEVLWRRDPVYTAPQAARLLGLSPNTLRHYCTAGYLPAERIQGGRRAGRWWAIRRSALAMLQVRRPASIGNRNSQRRTA